MTKSSVATDDLLIGYIEDLRRLGKHLRLFLLDSLRLGLPLLADPEIACVNFSACGREASGFEGHLRRA